MAYKLRILREADACSTPHEIGELLRREGLYISHLTFWRAQRDDGALDLSGRPRGVPAGNGGDLALAKLRRRLAHAEAELDTARKVIATQGRLTALLEQLLDFSDSQELRTAGH
jgi:hypothetical protein